MRLQTATFSAMVVSCCCFGCTDRKPVEKSELHTTPEPARLETEPNREDPDARFDALLSQFNAGVDEIRAEMLETLPEDEVNQTLWLVGPFERMEHLGPQFLQLAADNPGTEVAWKSLTWVVYVRGFRSEDKASAADQLIRDFANDQRLHDDLFQHLYRAGVVDKVDLYGRVLKSSEIPDGVRGLATYCLAVALVREGRQDLHRAAVGHLDKVISTYGELPHPYDPDRGSLGDAARRLRNEILHLQIGKVAPNIVGEDGHGERFQLSDYRGKVVLLVFCGDWCSPCRSLYPHEKALVEKHKDAPFAIVGVNSDDRETLKSVLEREAFPFRWFSDGSTTGPISLDWNVESWPTLYVLDREGTIRFKQIGASDTESLDQVIEQLLYGQ